MLGCINTAAYADVQKESKRILLLSGKKTHAYGHHENNAGISVLANLLQRQTQINFETQVFLDAAWPSEAQLNAADAIVIMSDGDAKHILKDKMSEFDTLLKNNKDLGLVFIHYATVPNGRKEADFNGEYFNKWIGGFYAGNSHNKTLTRWTHIQAKLPAHPVNNGVKPYTIFDEIYYRMEYVKGIKPIVVAESYKVVPNFHTNVEKSRYERDSQAVNGFKNELERTIFWSFERDDGGKSVATTMGHIHANFWTNKSIRKQMINSVAWVAGLQVPEAGFDALELSEAQLMLNHSMPKSK